MLSQITWYPTFFQCCQIINYSIIIIGYSPNEFAIQLRNKLSKNQMFDNVQLYSKPVSGSSDFIKICQKPCYLGQSKV